MVMWCQDITNNLFLYTNIISSSTPKKTWFGRYNSMVNGMEIKTSMNGNNILSVWRFWYRSTAEVSIEKRIKSIEKWGAFIYRSNKFVLHLLFEDYKCSSISLRSEKSTVYKYFQNYIYHFKARRLSHALRAVCRENSFFFFSLITKYFLSNWFFLKNE